MNCMYCVKRIFAVISLQALLFSTGCTVVPTTTGKVSNLMTGAFTAEVTITNADTESKAVLTRYGTDAWCVVFNEPQTLSGVQLDFVDDEVKASYKGLEFSVPQSAQAIKTELQDLMDIIDDMALTPDLNGKSDEGKLICDGAIEEGNYTLTFTDTGIPTEFSLPCYGLVILFDSFTQQGAVSQTPTETFQITTLPETVMNSEIETVTEQSEISTELVTETGIAEQEAMIEITPEQPQE
ncbi:MAG: hypothetical protein K2K06_07900 [Oscillospiraceae bacterium]|nr:hypothetical protein [Oscillospiraceae bacterium]